MSGRRGIGAEKRPRVAGGSCCVVDDGRVVLLLLLPPPPKYAAFAAAANSFGATRAAGAAALARRAWSALSFRAPHPPHAAALRQDAAAGEADHKVRKDRLGRGVIPRVAFLRVARRYRWDVRAHVAAIPSIKARAEEVVRRADAARVGDDWRRRHVAARLGTMRGIRLA